MPSKCKMHLILDHKENDAVHNALRSSGVTHSFPTHRDEWPDSYTSHAAAVRDLDRETVVEWAGRDLRSMVIWVHLKPWKTVDAFTSKLSDCELNSAIGAICAVTYSGDQGSRGFRIPPTTVGLVHKVPVFFFKKKLEYLDKRALWNAAFGLDLFCFRSAMREEGHTPDPVNGTSWLGACDAASEFNITFDKERQSFLQPSGASVPWDLQERWSMQIWANFNPPTKESIDDDIDRWFAEWHDEILRRQKNFNLTQVLTDTKAAAKKLVDAWLVLAAGELEKLEAKRIAESDVPEHNNRRD
jgi:hypothetical protein